MLVDNPLSQSYFQSTGASSSSSYPDFSDFGDFFNTDMFASNPLAGSSNNSNSPSSRESSPSSPFQALLTPPQSELPTSFPDIQDSNASNSGIFSIYDNDDLKMVDSMAPYDFMGVGPFSTSIDSSMPDLTMGMDMGLGYAGLNMMGMGMEDAMRVVNDSNQAVMGIDPQLVDTPSAAPLSEFEEEADDEASQSASSPAQEKEAEKEKLTLTIAPVKVGGHGKARKGTVQSGGVVKKTGSSSASTAASQASNITAVPLATSANVPAPASTKKAAPKAKSSEGDDDDDDDDLPHDWRPSPEVFAKMTSKEKRQLRNKISARNFRVRRKEYISTLEGDIAERDRLLDAIRSELGSTQSENLALRQEIATLKKTLLDGRGTGEPPVLNLPPPAPLPAQSAAASLAAAASQSASSTANLLAPNTNKDLPISPRLNQARAGFWGGMSGGLGMGGITPVHTTLVPEVPLVGKRGLQENINPALNGTGTGFGLGGPGKGVNGFDGFADLNPFTMKTLDAYRMHLWGKMAAQQHAHQQQQTANNHHSNNNNNHLPTGLASGLRPHFFTSATKHTLPSSTYGNTLSALLSGKSNSGASAYPSPPSSPQLGGKPSASERAYQQQREQQQKEQQTAMLAAMASQTIFKKLGSAFWDAFSGSSSSPATSAQAKNWDADKVRRVLEGKAVVRVVDLEPVTPPQSPRPAQATMRPTVPTRSQTLPSGAQEEKKCQVVMCGLLEESMRSLTLGKKA
ncbi:hypothetical protein BDQ12DRAFT_699877 [Crucibulum laeve]|uniref:BZIP domain-containing protein n=1 Tax=Crucibulum laeve TaxID=68775 RepID=A0A5C3LUR9_9AGAR|nr:hypothetical protein BDQ12DRAFT_699877 [Crucibulum laeve]